MYIHTYRYISVPSTCLWSSSCIIFRYDMYKHEAVVTLQCSNFLLPLAAAVIVLQRGCLQHLLALHFCQCVSWHKQHQFAGQGSMDLGTCPNRRQHDP